MTQTETAPGSDQVSRDMRRWLVVLTGLVAVLVVLVMVLLVKVNTLQGQVDMVELTASSAQPADVPVDDPRLDDVCRFIAVWAARSGVSIDQLFPGTTVGTCEQTATDGYSAAKQ
jgi:hypothetical protein